MNKLLRTGMLLCSFLLASVGWVKAEEESGGSSLITQETVRGYNYVFANGHAVTVTAASEEGKTLITVSEENTSESVTVASTSCLFGGSMNGTVANTSITMTSGTLARIYGGGYGSTAEKKAIVEGTATLVLDGGIVTNAVFGGGSWYSSVKNVVIKNSENKTSSIQVGSDGLQWLICAGEENGQTSGENYVEFEQSNNTVEQATLTLNGGKYRYIGFGGTDGARGYVKKVTATLQGATITGGVFGNGSNGRSDQVTATIRDCTFSEINWPIEIAAVNRGKSKEVSLTFKDCTFPVNSEDIYAYLGATYNTLLGYSGSEYGVPENVTFTFEGGTNVPAVGVSDGLSSAAVTLTGAKGYVAPFTVSETQTISAFTVPSGKTWTFNNGLTIAEGASLTKEGTLEVGVSSVAELTAAIAAGADKVTMAAGTYEMDATLALNKAITIEGAIDENGAPATTLQRKAAWSNTNNDTKHMVNITASKTQAACPPQVQGTESWLA